MDSAIKAVIESCSADSYAGAKHFGEIVTALAAAGVESYFADYRSRTTTYYLPGGDHLAIPLRRPDLQIPRYFNADAIRGAILGAQRGEVKYPRFLELSLAAGCVGYIVWIAGRHVCYYGRCGEVHVENFPSQT